MKIISLVLSAMLVCGMASPAVAQGRDRWTGRDKALHFSLGAALAAVGYAGAAQVTKNRKPRIVVGVTIGVGANGAKELRDHRAAGDPSWKDFAMGSLGSVMGTTVAWLIDRR